MEVGVVVRSLIYYMNRFQNSHWVDGVEQRMSPERGKLGDRCAQPQPPYCTSQFFNGLLGAAGTHKNVCDRTRKSKPRQPLDPTSPSKRLAEKQTQKGSPGCSPGKLRSKLSGNHLTRKALSGTATRNCFTVFQRAASNTDPR